MLRLTSIDLKKAKRIGTLVIPLCEDGEIHDNPALEPLINRAAAVRDFRGRKGDELILYGDADEPVERLMFLGLGKRGKLDAEALRRIGGTAVGKCMERDLADVLVAVPSAQAAGIETPVHLAALMEGATLGNHVFDRFKGESKKKPLRRIRFLVHPGEQRRFAGLAARVEAVCKGTLLAREWVSTPSNKKRPGQFSRGITFRARKAGLKVSVLDEKALIKNRCGAILAVAAGSDSRPRMVVLDYRPPGAKKTVALVGKGVTFDSGGINLKSSQGLGDMKADMAGGAAVAAALIAAAQLGSKNRVIGVIPLVENMPSGSASRPGDIIISHSGKSVEIGNTDAEGRLILIDAMSYAVKRFRPHILIDMATLTGACAVALGEGMAGLFTADDELADAITEAGLRTHERCWRLPLEEDYREMLKSDFADIMNVASSRLGGAITAALFLSEFTGDARWAHIDIAGPAYGKKKNAYCGPGGTGFGVRLLCDFLERW
jgi:leucyl aminopeptidase